MQFLTRPVFYMEDGDFDEKGNTTTINPNTPLFILLQSSRCYHCTESKPAFQALAVKYKDSIKCGTIQIDSPRTTPAFVKKMQYIYPDLVGFPSYILYFKGKKIVYDGNRTVQDMETFINRTIQKL